ncbi:MAG: PglZ domain-containing protein [Candidatus Methanosuratincola sp.]
MSAADGSFGTWLIKEIKQVLDKEGTQAPFIVWCDPGREWRELLQKAAEKGGFELWADDCHELVLRNRLYKEPPSPRVVWMPRGKEEITYMKVFELQAAEVIEISLLQALALYGVDIPPEQSQDLKSALPSHAVEWFDYPLQYWKDHFSKGGVHGTLVDDDTFIKVLASYGTPILDIIDSEKIPIFSRRAVEDFGLPPLWEPDKKDIDPEELDIDKWRLQALASLLVTEAAILYPHNPPKEPERIIEEGAARKNAMKILDRWKNNVALMNKLEEMAPEADKLTSLKYWAGGLEEAISPLTSPSAEKALFEREVEALSREDTFDELAELLGKRSVLYLAHAKGFWAEHVSGERTVPWSMLSDIAEMTGMLREQQGIVSEWKSPGDAVAWYIGSGWKVDVVGEILFLENSSMPGGLIGVWVKLRKAYLRLFDAVNSAFSELLYGRGLDELGLSYAGGVLKGLIGKPSSREPVVVLYLDAFRYDLGCRLAELLNKGEPSRRAEVKTAMAPLPSITALGMPFCLPIPPEELEVSLSNGDKPVWQVRAKGFVGNLAQLAKRREWLKKEYELKESAFLTIGDVLKLGDDEQVSSKKLGKLIFVFGDFFDTSGHEGELEHFGAKDQLDRCAKAIRRLRSGGYSKVIIATDHGYFHWEPSYEEILERPKGEVIWSSRRAMVGNELSHSSALSFKVPGSELQCLVPRSVSTFKAYGGMGFFHGGSTLQEMVIPLVIYQVPKKARKIWAILKPAAPITSLAPRVEVGPEAVQASLEGEIDENLLGREVQVKVINPETGKILFKTPAPVSIEPGGDVKKVTLEKVEDAQASAGKELRLLLVDADDEEILDQQVVELRIDIDEWL